MLYLGVDADIVYEAMNFRSGLRGIYAHARAPDGEEIGPIVLEEGSGPHQAGVYFGKLPSRDNGPEGRYIVGMVSPQENDRRSTIALDYCRRPVDSSAISAAVRPINISGTVLTGSIDGYLDDGEDLTAELSQGIISGYLKPVTRLQGHLGDVSLCGVLRPVDQI